MPIRSQLTLATALAGAILSGGWLASAQAADIGLAPAAEADMRDLRPSPTKPPGPGIAARPEVTLRPSAPVIPVGAPITFEVSSSVNGFGHIYVLSASGRVQVWMENVPIAAGQRLVFPTGGLGIKAAAPAGREELMLIVTKGRFDGFFGHEGTDEPRLLDYSHASFKQKLTTKFADLPHRQWGYARTSVQVVDRVTSAPGWGWNSGSRNSGAGHAPTDFWAEQWEQQD